MRSLLWYLLSRVVLFAACWLAAQALPVAQPWRIVIALVASSIISFFVLRELRDAVAQQIVTWMRDR